MLFNGALQGLEPKLTHVRLPVLVIHGEQDDVIPVELVRHVFNAAPDPNTLYLVPGAGHNDCYVVGGQAYLSRIASFAKLI